MNTCEYIDVEVISDGIQGGATSWSYTITLALSTNDEAEKNKILNQILSANRIMQKKGCVLKVDYENDMVFGYSIGLKLTNPSGKNLKIPIRNMVYSSLKFMLLSTLQEYKVVSENVVRKQQNGLRRIYSCSLKKATS